MSLDADILALPLHDWKRLAHVASGGRLPPPAIENHQPTEKEPPTAVQTRVDDRPPPVPIIFQLDNLAWLPLEQAEHGNLGMLNEWQAAYATLLQSWRLAIRVRRHASRVYLRALDTDFLTDYASQDRHRALQDLHDADATVDEHLVVIDSLTQAYGNGLSILERVATAVEAQRTRVNTHQAELAHLHKEIKEKAMREMVAECESLVTNDSLDKDIAIAIGQLLDNECGVCRNALQQPCALPCGHVFCFECAFSWMSENTNCPTCRMSMELNTRTLELLNFQHCLHEPCEAINNAAKGSIRISQDHRSIIWRSMSGAVPERLLEIPIKAIQESYITTEGTDGPTLVLGLWKAFVKFSFHGKQGSTNLEKYAAFLHDSRKGTPVQLSIKQAAGKRRRRAVYTKAR